jgi:hypothetical protein
MFGTESWGIVAIGGCIALLANILYQLGGIGNKWLRRYVASFLLAATTSIIGILVGNWHWQYILIWPCLVGGFSLGYGADTTMAKVIRRTIYAIGVLAACFMGLWATGFSVGGILVTGLALITGLTSIVLGVFNPFKSARVEEFMVCQVLTLYIPFWAYIK